MSCAQATTNTAHPQTCAVEVNLFRHTYNTLRPHQALDERTPRAAYLAVEHCD
jgi:transposase InsO family protein